MTQTHPLDADGHYVGDHDRVRPRLWFDAADGDRTRIDTLDGRSPDGPNWGYRGSGPNATADAILFHATGDLTVVELCGQEFAGDVIARLPYNQPFTLPAATVQRWLADHGVDLTGPWGPLGAAPRARHEPTADHPDRYVVAVDGWDTLTVDLDAHGEHAHVAIRDLDVRDDTIFDRAVTYAYPDEAHPAPAAARVAIQDMPFGGWMVTADGHDLASVERDRDQPDRLRLRVNDRTLPLDQVAFDATIRHRHLPDRAAALAAADRLRRFTSPHPTERSLSR
jgi:hypothetical protein